MNRVDPGGSDLGRYALYGPIARGGMATVFFGRLRGPAGFARTVAIKRLHPQFAAQPEFVSMFVDEARLAARIRSPHVVSTLDVVATEGELFLVMDYVAGESLARLQKAAAERGERIPIPIAVAILSGVLQGLHAAHEASSEAGEPLGIVHRDVSPQNVLVGTDGLARVLDFGVAKASGRLQSTRDGELKGKLGYMPPEQLRQQPITRRGDVHAASVVLWEALTGKRLFDGADEGAIVTGVLLAKVQPPSRAIERAARLTDDLATTLERLDPLVLRGLDREPSKRFATAGEMAIALEQAVPPASPREVSEWVQRVAGDALAERAKRVAEIESGRVEAQAVAVEREPGDTTLVEAPTQTVGVSAAAPLRARAPAKTWGVAVAGVAALALAGALALRVRAPSQAPRELPAAGAPSASIAEPDANVPAAPAAAPTTPSVAASASGSPKPSPPPPAPRKRPASDCNPPFTFDAQGKKHYKAQCL